MIHKLVKVRGAGFCDDQFPIISTIGRGPKGEQGEQGETLKFANPVEWDSGNAYETLTVVLYQGDSYISKQAVPVGTDISDEEYWVHVGDFNAQIEQYHRETEQYRQEVAGVSEQVENLAQLLPDDAFDATNTIKVYIDSKIADSYNSLADNREPIHIDRIIDNDNDKFCFVVKVPRKDFYIDFVGGTGLKTNDTPDYAVKIADRSEITTNCSLVGVCVIDGNRIRERVTDSEYFQVLGFNANGDAVLFTDPQTTTQQIINGGCIDGFGIWGCLIKEGAKYPIASVISDPDNPYYESLVNVNHIRCGFGIDENYWYYFVILGRLAATYGATWDATQDILFKYNAGADWYMFDGGGSVQCYTKDGNNLVPYSDSGEGMNETRSRRMYMTFKERQNA